MVEIIPATSEILKAHYKEPFGKSVYAIAAVEDGRVLGVAGFYYRPVGAVVFADISELRSRPKVLIRGYRMILEKIRQKGLTAYAKCDQQIEAAERFLRHIGFQPFENDLFVWQPRSHS